MNHILWLHKFTSCRFCHLPTQSWHSTALNGVAMVAWIEIKHEFSNKDSYTVKLPLIQMHSHSAKYHTRLPFEPFLKRWTIPRQKCNGIEYRIPGRNPPRGELKGSSTVDRSFLSTGPQLTVLKRNWQNFWPTNRGLVITALDHRSKAAGPQSCSCHINIFGS